MGNRQNQAPDGGGGQRDSPGGPQAALFQKIPDVHLVIVIVGSLHPLGKPAQKEFRVPLDEDESLRLRQPAAGGKNGGRRPTSGILLGTCAQRFPGHRETLRMDILQHGEKQQLLGIKKFVKGAL